ncbi:hypothetical protein LH51_13815 [Nitrincola sp. A-D6]|uniref:PAS domain S-box protein n=1 Tax=Nitrincola sp. A-D6 TaxID=1545442 RepID=UPI00051FD0E8|nr:PAS domain S-box protein [Nitrincola sp. A-D6]KGK41560.1 hypothetical protein LH51_13815 [Nitrincola sp. A-D6]
MSQIVPLLRTSQQGVLVFHAVYEQGQHPLFTSELSGAELPLKGFVVGVYDIDLWLEPLLDLAQDKGMRLRVSDVTNASDHHVFWTDLADTSQPVWVRDVDIAGRSWRLEMQPEAQSWKPGASLEEQLYLAFSVVAAFMAVFATLGSAGRYAATRGEVATRTRELREELQAREVIEQALQESESRYRNLIETAPFTILLQHEGKVVYLNSQGIKIFGADSLEHVVGYSVLELVQPDHRDTIYERIRRISAGETLSEIVTLTCLRMDGTPFEAEWSSVPYEMDNGFGSLVVLQDVTARKAAEEQLDRFFFLVFGFTLHCR